MIKTTVTKIVLSDEDSQALLNSVKVIDSIYDAMLDVDEDATLTTYDGVDISTEDFYKYLMFIRSIKRDGGTFIIEEDTKEI